MWSEPKIAITSALKSSIRFRFWSTASAVPRYQPDPKRICGGTTVTKKSGSCARPPRDAQVLDERLRFVLDEDVDRRELGVHEVRQHEIDEPEPPAERHRRLGALAGERLEPLALAAGHDHREDPGPPRHRAQPSPGGPMPHAGSRSGKQKSSRSSRRSEFASSGESGSPEASPRAISERRLNSA